METSKTNIRTQQKEKILSLISKIIDDKIQIATIAIQSAKESRDNETKSSAGDKYETGRSMMQFEIEKNYIHLQKLQAQKFELSQLNLSKTSKNIEFGNLVFTNYDNYFMSAGIGKIEVLNESYVCISPTSPIGKLIRKKVTGDKFNFQGKEIEIIDFY